MRDVKVEITPGRESSPEDLESDSDDDGSRSGRLADGEETVRSCPDRYTADDRPDRKHLDLDAVFETSNDSLADDQNQNPKKNRADLDNQ